MKSPVTWLRTSFATRLLLGVLAALVVSGGLGFVVVDTQLRGAFQRSAAEQQRAELTAARATAASLTDRGHPRRGLSAIADRLGSSGDARRVALTDASGHVVAGTGMPAAAARQRLDGLRRRGRAERAVLRLHPARLEYTARIGRGPHAYAVILDRDLPVVDRELHDVHRSLLLAGLLALATAIVLSYLLAGRALSRRHESALQRATRDGLTDLANHRAFQDELAQAAAEALRTGEDFALAVMDIDDFKFTNDRHGHPHGDALLQRMGHHLREDIRLADRAFRVGGDEFAVLLPRCGEADAKRVMHRIRQSMLEDGLKVSMGVSVTRPGMRDSATLREEADAALYEAKRLGRPKPVGFGSIRSRVTVRTTAKVSAVRAMLDERAVDVAYQPIFDLRSEALLGVEALARPRSPALNGPADAFDVAEQDGCVPALDRLCAETAIAGAAGLPDDVLLFVNLSPATLDVVEDGFAWLADAVVAAGIAPGRLVVEITERSGTRPGGAAAGAALLRGLGLRLALDDVGAGDAGLGRMRSLRADFVKIDREVIRTAGTDDGARAVLAAIAVFAHESGAVVVAEGIEDAAVLRYVRTAGAGASWEGAGIHAGQGYGLARPQRDLATALAVPMGARLVAA